MTQLHEGKYSKEALVTGKLKKGMTFHEKVWALTARVPAGKVVTYGDIAKKLDSTAYRAVGQAMNRNPYSPAVPCHRVVGSTGKLTGFARGLAKKEAMLREEGVEVENGKVNLKTCRGKL